jgi:hypothetical protein
VLHAAQVAHDARQGGGDDALVQRGERHHEHQAADDAAEFDGIGRGIACHLVRMP